MMLKAFGCLLLTLVQCSGYSNGPPQSVCLSMSPSHGVSPQSSEAPYRITIDQGDTYTGGQSLTMRIVKNSGAADFKGFIVQARPEGGPAAQGTFTTVSDGKMMTCNNADDTITHNNGGMKSEVSATWVAPTNYQAPLQFYATVVESKRMFWVKSVLSPVIVLEPPAITCPNLPDIENAQKSGDSNQVGRQVVYTCNSGYKPKNDADMTRTCMSDGTWSGQTPQCEEITKVICPDLTAPGQEVPNSSMTGSSNNHGSMVTYTCDAGYQPQDSITRICRSDGTWSGEPPVCTRTITATTTTTKIITPSHTATTTTTSLPSATTTTTVSSTSKTAKSVDEQTTISATHSSCATSIPTMSLLFCILVPLSIM